MPQLQNAVLAAGVDLGPGPSGEVPESLRYFEAQTRYPSGRGQLGYVKSIKNINNEVVELNEGGTWSAQAAQEADPGSFIEAQAASCEYLFESHMQLIAGASYWVGLTVTNPADPLKQSDVDNEWQIRGMGQRIRVLGSILGRF